MTAIYEKRLDEDEQKLARTLALQGPQPRQSLFSSSATEERRITRDALGNLLDTLVLEERSNGSVAHRYGLLRRVIQIEAKELGYAG